MQNLSQDISHINKWDVAASKWYGNLSSAVRAVKGAISLPVLAIISPIALLVDAKWEKRKLSAAGEDLFKGVLGIVPLVSQIGFRALNNSTATSRFEEHISEMTLLGIHDAIKQITGQKKLTSEDKIYLKLLKSNIQKSNAVNSCMINIVNLEVVKLIELYNDQVGKDDKLGREMAELLFEIISVKSRVVFKKNTKQEIFDFLISIINDNEEISNGLEIVINQALIELDNRNLLFEGDETEFQSDKNAFLEFQEDLRYNIIKRLNHPLSIKRLNHPLSEAIIKNFNKLKQNAEKIFLIRKALFAAKSGNVINLPEYAGFCEKILRKQAPRMKTLNLYNLLPLIKEPAMKEIISKEIASRAGVWTELYDKMSELSESAIIHRFGQQIYNQWIEGLPVRAKETFAKYTEYQLIKRKEDIQNRQILESKDNIELEEIDKQLQENEQLRFKNSAKYLTLKEVVGAIGRIRGKSVLSPSDKWTLEVLNTELAARHSYRSQARKTFATYSGQELIDYIPTKNVVAWQKKIELEEINSRVIINGFRDELLVTLASIAGRLTKNEMIKYLRECLQDLDDSTGPDWKKNIERKLFIQKLEELEGPEEF